MSQRGGPNPYRMQVGDRIFEVTDMFRFLFFMHLKMSRGRLTQEEAFGQAAHTYARMNKAHADRAREPQRKPFWRRMFGV